MTSDKIIEYLIQLIPTAIVFSFLIGKYKAVFEHQNKVLNQHEDALRAIMNRLDSMNNEFSFMKGWVSSRGD